MIQSVPRWGPQFPVSYPPNYLAGNRGGRGARGGPGHSGHSGHSGPSGQGGASGPSNRQGQVRTNRSQTPNDEFSLQYLSAFPFDQQKLFLGERLYPMIGTAQPELAGKITGMFLDSGWSIEELFSLVQDKNKLAEKIEDAVLVLAKAQTEHQEIENSA